MCNHQDVQHIGSHAVDQRVGETVEDEPAEFVVKMRTDFRMFLQKVCSTANFDLEVVAQTRHLKFVVACRLDEFQFRFRVELNPHRFKRARRFSKTRSAGTGFTFPSMISR